MARAGRTRKQGRRLKDGQLALASRTERAEDMQAVAVMARRRHAAAEAVSFRDEDGAHVTIAANDALWGYQLGILYARQYISGRQRDALEEYGRRRRDFLRIATEGNPNPASPGFIMVGGGLSCAAEPDDDVSLRQRRRHADMMAELRDFARLEAGSLLSVAELLDRLCVRDQAVGWTLVNAGLVRAAANVLARHFGM